MLRKRSEIKSETKSESTAVSTGVDRTSITHDFYMGHWQHGEIHGLGVLIEGSESGMEAQLEACCDPNSSPTLTPQP